VHAGRDHRASRCWMPRRGVCRARENHHLLTSSITYSCSASHEPEHMILLFTLPVTRMVPGSTLCQQVRVNGIASAMTSDSLVVSVIQSWPESASRATFCRVRDRANRLEALGATRAYRVQPDKATMASGFITMDYRRMIGRRWQPMKPPADLAFDSQNGWSSLDVC